MIDRSELARLWQSVLRTDPNRLFGRDAERLALRPDSGDELPQPGFVGASYQPGGVLFLGNNPGKGTLPHSALEERHLRALRNLKGADPDNGLETRAGVPRHRLTGPKYAYFDELAPYLDRGQSLVVYHHLHRSLVHERQVRDRLSQVEERLGPAFALRYRPGTGRVFFVVPSEAHREILRERAARFAEHPCWSRHFSLVEPG